MRRIFALVALLLVSASAQAVTLNCTGAGALFPGQTVASCTARTDAYSGQQPVQCKLYRCIGAGCTAFSLNTQFTPTAGACVASTGALPTGTYVFQMTGIDSAGVESVASNQYTVVSAVYVAPVPLPAPTNLRVTSP